MDEVESGYTAISFYLPLAISVTLNADKMLKMFLQITQCHIPQLRLDRPAVLSADYNDYTGSAWLSLAPKIILAAVCGLIGVCTFL